MAKVTTRLVWFAGALGLILLGSALMLPTWIRTQLQTRLSQSLHRPVSVAAVRFSLWTGHLEIQDLKIFEPNGKTLLAGADGIELQWSLQQSLWQRAPTIQRLTLIHPRLNLVLLAAHQLNVTDLLPKSTPATPSPSDSPLTFAVHQLELSDGTIDFEDVAHHEHHQLEHLRLRIPLISSLEGVHSPALEPDLEARLDGTPVHLTGHLQPFAQQPQGQLHIQVRDLPLTRFLEYLPAMPGLQTLTGLATLHLQLSYAPPSGSSHAAAGLTAQGELTLQNGTLQLTAPRPLRLVWDQAQAHLQGLRVSLPTGALQLDRFQLQLRGATFTDEANHHSKPMRVAHMELAVQPMRWPLSQSSDAPKASDTSPTTVDLHVQLASSTPPRTGAAKPDPKSSSRPVEHPTPVSRSPAKHATVQSPPDSQSLHVSGTIQWLPLRAQLDLDLNRLELAPFNPYLLTIAPVLLARGELGIRGHLTLEQVPGGALQEHYQGQLLATHLQVLDAVDAQELGHCQALFATGIHLHSAPPSLRIEQLVLNDFSTRLVLDPRGHLNLEHLTTPNAVPSSTTAPNQHPASPGTPAPFWIGKVIVQGGHVHYRDHFIQPHFGADLDDLGGVITPVSPGKIARIDLRGSVNTAPLTIQGQMDPTMQDLSLDIQGQITGMDLSPLTPYADKYLGYGIAQGKLSFQANYQLRQQQLTARNHLILDQLKLGPAVHSPEATHLPVELALSLLQDRNGVIDVHLPIEGSLNDPQFSVAGIVWRMLENLLEKAVTSPFAMLQSFFEDHRRASWIPFEPGESTLNPGALKKLQALSRALQARPRLKLDLQGHALAAQDAEPLRRQLLAHQVEQLWVQQRLTSGHSAPGAEHPSPDTEQALLQQIYNQTDFVKPRNAFGFQKHLSAEDMKKLLLANMPVDQNALQRLAQQRAQTAQDWLIHTGGIAPERLSLIQESRKQAAALSAAAPEARVDFFLH